MRQLYSPEVSKFEVREEHIQVQEMQNRAIPVEEPISDRIMEKGVLKDLCKIGVEFPETAKPISYPK